MIHVQTGNALDVVYDFEGDRKVLKGLIQHGRNTIVPLREPQGLVNVLQAIIAEIRGEADNEFNARRP